MKKQANRLKVDIHILIRGAVVISIRIFLIGNAAFASLYAMPALAEATGGVCQVTAMPDGSRVKMCQDGKGKWRSEPSDADLPQENRNLPARAEITYSGQYDGTVTITQKVNLNNLSIASVLQSALSTQRKPFQGNIVFKSQLSGSTVTATVSGSGGLNARQLSGQVRNGTCHLVSVGGQGTAAYDGQCGTNGFSGTFKGMTEDGYKYQGQFEASTTQVVDLDQREKEQLAAQRAQAAQLAAAEARLRNAPAAGPVLTKKFNGYVQADARGWAFNRYDSGSLTNVKIIDGSVKSGHYVMRGEYTYNGGASGWVLAKMSGPNLECIQFHDALVGCRGLRTAAQGQAMRSAALGALSGEGEGSRGGLTDQQAQENIEQAGAAARRAYEGTYNKPAPF